MNDPHLVALIYRVKHADSISYDSAEALEFEKPEFYVRVKNGIARFEMRDHFATAEAAREVVEPLIREWEFSTSLDRGPGEFDLIFADADIEDRKPTPGVHLVVSEALVAIEWQSAKVARNTYPSPPAGIALDADVTAMAYRYFRYLEGRDTLAGMGYFCLTVLEKVAGGRPSITRAYGIHKDVTDAIGRLTSRKGGLEARKAGGRDHEFTPAERAWLESAIKRLIRRAAEVAHDPSAARSQITMADLPTL